MSSSATCAVAASAHCASSELWITYHQASRARKQVTAQLVDVSDAALLFDLEDVLDHIFQQGFVDPKWRSVAWWEECTSARLKASHTIQELLARGAGSSPASALRLVIGTMRRLFPFFFCVRFVCVLTVTWFRSGHSCGHLGTLRVRALRASAHRNAAHPSGPATGEGLRTPGAHHELYICARIPPVQSALYGVLEGLVREAHRRVRQGRGCTLLG